MFWQFESASVSQIDTLIEKEDVTLAQLMDEDDIIQECKSQNQKLIQYLIKPEITDQLVDLIIRDPEDVEDEKKKYKKSNIACELLTCDVPLMNEVLAAIPVLNKLSSFIDTDDALNPLLASFFSKTMILVCLKKPESMLTFLKENESFTQNLIKHLETSALMDLLLKLSSGIEIQESRLAILTVLTERNVLKSVYDRFKPSCTPDEQSNAATYLCDVIKAGREHRSLLQEKAEVDPLLEQIESTEMVSLLLDNIFEGNLSETALVSGISVLQSLLEYKRHCANLQPPIQQQNESSSNSDFEGMPQCLSDQQIFNKLEVATEPVSSLDADRLSKCVRQVHAAVVHRLSDFHNILMNPPPKEPIETTVGQIVPLGACRLEVAHLIRALVSSNNPEINSKLVELKTFPLLINLFFSYPWNNFLHTQVEHSIQAILGSTKRSSPVTSPNPQDTGHEVATQLFHDLMVEGQLVTRILDAFKPNDSSKRLGYMGHLIKMANLIVEHGAEDPVKSYFQNCDQEMSEQWNTFVESELNQINKIQRTPLVEERVQQFEDNLKQESALHNAFVEYQMQQMTRNLCAQIGFDTSDFTELDDLPIQAQADHLSKINFNLELDSTIRRRSSSDKESDNSSSDESPDGSEKPPGSFPVDLDQGMDIDRLGPGELTDPTMDTCEAWTAPSSSAAKTPEDEWADFDTFAAQRVSHTSDAVMKDNSQNDAPVEPKPSEQMSSDVAPLTHPSNPIPEVTNMEQQPIEGLEK